MNELDWAVLWPNLLQLSLMQPGLCYQAIQRIWLVSSTVRSPIKVRGEGEKSERLS